MMVVPSCALDAVSESRGTETLHYTGIILTVLCCLFGAGAHSFEFIVHIVIYTVCSLILLCRGTEMSRWDQKGIQLATSAGLSLKL